MAVILMTLALISCCHGVHGKGINSLIGPYIAYAERFYMCEPDNRADNRPLPWTWHLRVTHFNPYKPKELQRLTGNVTTTIETLDDSCWLKIVLDTRSNNQWKENAFVFNFLTNGCRVIKENIPGYYEQVLKKSEVNGACVFKPGVHEVNNAPTAWIFPNVPILPYGKYRTRIMLGKADNQYACWCVDVGAVPKHD